MNKLHQNIQASPRRSGAALLLLRPAAGIALLGLVLALIALPARAQPFTIDWFTVDGGGGMLGTGGPFTLSGTIGQPAAGVLAGGLLDGGFWAIIGPIPPRLTITVVGPDVQICWPSPSTGFSLQQSTSVDPTVWTPVVQVPTDNGITKCVTLPHSGSTSFYRLSNP